MSIARILADHRDWLDKPSFTSPQRRALTDALSTAGETHRVAVYAAADPTTTTVTPSALTRLFTDALAFVDHSLRSNRRPDGLFHSYNLLEFIDEPAQPPGLLLSHIPPMLEGQVAILSSGLLLPAEVVQLLHDLRASNLHRPDLNTYLLYPDRELPRFLARNIIPPDQGDACPLFRALLDARDSSLVETDPSGALKFHPDLVNAAALDARLDQLAINPRWSSAVTSATDQVHAIYESVFRHREFTGRSGTMFGFEGLGCVYWHMVAKLLLAVQESLQAAQDSKSSAVPEIVRAYYDVRDGLGFNHQPTTFGAFPTDPYSHTPGHSGAQQPGMTGQVKEEILTRFGELGVRITDGRIAFQPTFLRVHEFSASPSTLIYPHPSGGETALTLPTSSLGFTFTGVPVVYHLTTDDTSRFRVTYTNPETPAPLRDGHQLDLATSTALLQRQPVIARIDVYVPGSQLA
ncbi:MAG: hypothetical protein J6386_02530 [Candidatus Synoicihabitans palmerolidicus]|nr:hypothetical protein [Candidatus Synoicihabitans palmerolidicus]